MFKFSTLSTLVSSAVFAIVLGAMASPANAVFIFQDNFNRADSDTVGSGWSETEDESDDVAIRSNALQIRDFNPFGMASQLGGLATTGLNNIMLSYDWSNDPLSEDDDQLIVEWKLATDGSWTNLASHGLGDDTGTVFSNTAALGIGAGDVTNLQFRFRVVVSTALERAVVDNVALTGDPIKNSTGIPEPGTLGLLGFGLTGLGVLRRRMKKA